MKRETLRGDVKRELMNRMLRLILEERLQPIRDCKKDLKGWMPSEMDHKDQGI